MRCLEFFLDGKDYLQSLDNKIFPFYFLFGMEAIITIVTTALHDLSKVI